MDLGWSRRDLAPIRPPCAADFPNLDLTAMLTRFKQASLSNRVDASVTIAPEDAVPHQWVVRVMDACAASGIDEIRFAVEE